MKTWWLCIVTVAACGGGGDDGGPSFSDEHPRIYLQANKERLAAQLAAGAEPARRFKETVDMWVDGREVYGFEAWHAALVGQLTGDPKYCAAAIADIEKQVAAAEKAIGDGDTPPVAGDSYLDVGNMIGDLALVYDWCHAEIGDKRERWLSYANQAVWNVWNPEQAKWGDKVSEWSGWGTDDPSNNYHYSFLRATMLLGLAANGELPAGSDDWRTMFHDQLIMTGLVPVFERDLVGGGSREGTGYGVAMNNLFHTYDLWEGSTGESIAKRTAHTKASMLAMMHQTVPTLDFVAPTGDHSRDSTAAWFDYHRRYLQELVHLYPDDPEAAAAKTFLAECSVPEMENRFMFVYDFLYENAGVTAKPLDTLATAYHAPGIGQLYARSAWTKDASWINFIAGPYDQSHAHQDQGSLMIYKGAWLAFDANWESHSGLRQEVDAHSLVRVVAGGKSIEQRTNTSSPLVALHKGAKYVHAAADITPAYKGQANITRIQRELVYLTAGVVVVYDRVNTKAGTEQVWQLVTPTRPVVAGARATITNQGHTLTVDRISADGTTTVADLTADSDFNGGFRLQTTLPAGDQRILHVLSTDGAVTQVTPETDGVTVTLAAGGTAKVVFVRDNVGATLTLDGSTTNLGATVDTLP